MVITLLKRLAEKGAVSVESNGYVNPLLVTGVNPLRIVHASSAAGCVTTDVLINADNGGRVNIRAGNGFNYGKITSVQSGTTLPYIATADNGWLAVKVKNVVGWVSPEYAGTKE